MRPPYPYNPETNKLPNNDETDTWPNPMVALGYLAAVTKKVKLGTCITILPLHHTIEMATQWAALDVLCNGRSILGIGSGWLKEEFEALDVNWHQRGSRTDESMRAMRVLWREDPSTFKGKHFNFEALRCFPKPVQKGASRFSSAATPDAAARRAARLGDGFFPVGEPHELAASFKEMEAECARIGRNPNEIERFVGGGNPAGFNTDEVARDDQTVRGHGRHPDPDSRPLPGLGIHQRGAQKRNGPRRGKGNPVKSARPSGVWLLDASERLAVTTHKSGCFLTSLPTGGDGEREQAAEFLFSAAVRQGERQANARRATWRTQRQAGMASPLSHEASSDVSGQWRSHFQPVETRSPAFMPTSGLGCKGD